MNGDDDGGVKSLTCEDVCSLFDDSPAIANVLAREKVDGFVLSTATEEDLKSVGLTTLQARAVLRKRERASEAAVPCSQEPRPFLMVGLNAQEI